MRIGIDGKWYFKGPTGPRTVARNIINSLARIDRQNEYIIYLDKDDDPGAVDYDAPNFITKPLAPSQSWVRVMWTLSREARRDRLDVLYTANHCPLFAPCKRVVIIHDILFRTHPEYFSLVEHVFFSPMRYTSHLADFVQTISNYCNETIAREYRLPEEQIVTTLLACNDTFTRSLDREKLAAARLKYNLPKRYVLYVGRLNARKNLIRLIEAFSQVPDKDVRLVIVGARDWKASNLAPIIEASPARDRLIFLGHIPDEDLPLIYQLAEVFAYVPIAEGFGLPPLEAMGCGVPVITSNTSSLPEVVGDAALTVNPLDVGEIRDALDTLLGSDSLREQLGKQGLERAKLFSWDQAARETLQLLERAYRGKGS